MIKKIKNNNNNLQKKLNLIWLTLTVVYMIMWNHLILQDMRIQRNTHYSMTYDIKIQNKTGKIYVNCKPCDFARCLHLQIIICSTHCHFKMSKKSNHKISLFYSFLPNSSPCHYMKYNKGKQVMTNLIEFKFCIH